MIKPHTPSFITHLNDNEIFVFGSNKEGMHGGLAAATAYKHFGTQWGVGVGRTGQCYAIPTMDHSIDLIAEYVEGFRCYAACHPELVFFCNPNRLWNRRMERRSDRTIVFFCTLYGKRDSASRLVDVQFVRLEM